MALPGFTARNSINLKGNLDDHMVYVFVKNNRIYPLQEGCDLNCMELCFESCRKDCSSIKDPYIRGNCLSHCRPSCGPSCGCPRPRAGGWVFL